MNKTSSLRLVLPERTPVSRDSIFLDIREVESWVSGLPIANIGETSKQVFKTLVELNRIDLPNINRVTIANMLRPAVRHITSNLRKYYLDAPIPLTAKNQKVVVLCRELQMELANCYKIIVERINSGQGEKDDRKLMAVALHQAIHYLSRALYYSVVAYNPYPKNIWREMHQLYLFAEQSGLADLTLKDGSDSKNPGSSISDIYQNALLLALASPYGLRQKEIEELYLKLPEWTKHIRILSSQSEVDSAGQFLVDAEIDEPPVHISMREKQESGQYHLIETQSLAQHLRLELKTIYSNQTAGSVFTKEMQITAPLLRKVIKSLTYEPKRGFIRTSLHFNLDVAVGIADIHTHITTNKTKQTTSDPEASDIDTNKKEPTSKPSFFDGRFSADDDSIQIVPMDYPVDGIPYYSPRQMLDNIIEDDDVPAWARQTRKDRLDTFSCKTINESAGGYCISWKGENAPKVKVGDLIGIQSASDHSQFSIGIARWLKHTPEDGLQLGFEIISPTSEAVKIHTTPNKHQASISQKCIMLPKNTATRRPNSLVIPIMNIYVGEEIKIESDTAKRPAKLIRLLESTGTFSQYEFAYLDDNISS